VCQPEDVDEPPRWLAKYRDFQLTSATDVARDGVGLELVERGAGPDHGAALEIFYRDDIDHWTFSAEHVADLPLDLIEAFIAEARRRLTPNDIQRL